MSDNGSSVTLIFYRVGKEWWKEPALNLPAAAAQMSPFCHVVRDASSPHIHVHTYTRIFISYATDVSQEIGIGEASGSGGQIANVARIFNDSVGVVNVFVAQFVCV